MEDRELLNKAREYHAEPKDYLVKLITAALEQKRVEPTEQNITKVWVDIAREVVPNAADDSIDALLDKGEL